MVACAQAQIVQVTLFPLQHPTTCNSPGLHFAPSRDLAGISGLDGVSRVDAVLRDTLTRNLNNNSLEIGAAEHLAGGRKAEGEILNIFV